MTYKKYFLLSLTALTSLTSTSHALSWKSVMKKTTQAMDFISDTLEEGCSETIDFFSSLSDDVFSSYKKNAQPHVKKVYNEAKINSKKIYQNIKKYYDSNGEKVPEEFTVSHNFSIESTQGDLEIVDNRTLKTENLPTSNTLPKGKTLHTNQNAAAHINIQGHHSKISLILNENSTLGLDDAKTDYHYTSNFKDKTYSFTASDEYTLYLAQGQVILNLPKPNTKAKIQIHTPAGSLKYLNGMTSFDFAHSDTLRVDFKTENNGQSIIVMLFDK